MNKYLVKVYFIDFGIVIQKFHNNKLVKVNVYDYSDYSYNNVLNSLDKNIVRYYILDYKALNINLNGKYVSKMNTIYNYTDNILYLNSIYELEKLINSISKKQLKRYTETN